jgi:hypothetical protein
MSRGRTRREILGGIAGAGAVSVVPGRSSAESDPEVDWQSTVGNSDADELEGVVALDSGGMLAFGSGRLVALVAPMEPDGTVTRVRPVTNGESSAGNLVAGAASPDGGAVLMGYSQDPTVDPVPYVGWVVKLDGDGNVVWQETVAEDDHFAFDDVVRDDDGFVAVGRTWNDDSVTFSTDEPDRNVLVLGLDADGDERWRSYLASRVEGTHSTGIAASDSGYCVVGNGREEMEDSLPSNPSFAIGLDDEGTKQWRTRYDSAHKIPIDDVCSDCDGGFVLVGADMPQDGGTSGLAIRMDDEGTERWRMTHDASGVGRFSQVELTGDGFLCTALAAPDGGEYPFEARLVGVGPGGDIWFQKTIRRMGWEYRSSGLAVPDRRRAVVAFREQSPPENQEPNVVGTDTPGRSGGTWDCPRMASASQSSSSSSELPGFGAGMALGGIGVGAGLLEARRRRSNDD